jgi:hypothetical protein
VSDSVLQFPLTKKALLASFAALEPESVTVDKRPGWHEGCVNGAWSLTKLMAHIKALGFDVVGRKDQLLFVNGENTVGLQLFGVAPHPTKNTWKTYSVEVQARPKSKAAEDAKRPHRPATLWPC